MAKIQCKMCGGELNLPENTASGTCEYCGTLITFPKVSDERLENLYNRAEHFRKIHDYGKAVQVYEQYITANPEDSEAYWGLVLSRYGIEYVEDPASHERIPTCHRMSYDSILSDADYLSALEHAGYAERQIYENEAKRIAEIQKGILAISSQEQPFDVFICYKESDDYGRRTKDSVTAQEIYYELTDAGYKVFFARVTLESKLGQQYEPYIFAALNSAKVMLVVGSKKEYFEAVWVRNEWSRYLELMKKDRKRLLIPCYKDMDAYDIPDELSMFQSQDMGKIGFVQDVLRGIQKVCKKGESKPAAAAPVSNPGNSNANALLRRAEIMISTGDFENAKSYLQRFLDQDPENGWGYFNLILTELQLTDRKMLVNFPNIRLNSNFKLAEQFADDKLKELLNEIIHEQEEIKRKAEEERRRQEEERRRWEEEQRRLAEEQRKAEEERRRLEEERRARNRAVSEAAYGRIVLLRQHYDLEYNLNGPSSLAQRLQGCIDRENHLQSNPELSEAEISDIIMTSEATMAECGDLEVKKQLLEQKRKKQTKIILSVLAAIALIVFCCFIPTIIDHIRGYETSDGVLVKALDRTRTEFEIHDGVTTIGACAFSECSNLKSITIPNSVIKIGREAFYDCDYLTSVTIPNSVTTIGDKAFYDCDYLTSITIPNSVTEIGSEVFYGCDNLTTITIPNSVTAIGDSAFKSSGLKLAYIPKNCIVSETAFDSTVQLIRLASEDYKTLESAENGNAEAQYRMGKIFSDHKMSDTAVEWYRKSADQGNANAQYELGKFYIIGAGINYNEGVKWLNKAAEKGHVDAQFELGSCYAKEMKYSEAISWLNKAAEKGHVDAKQLLENVKKWKNAEQFYELSEDRTTLVRCKDKKITVAVIPDFITTIGSQAFQNCTALTSITFQGNNVTSIRASAFEGCSSLKNIIIPDSVTSIGNEVFEGCSSLIAIYVSKESQLSLVKEYDEITAYLTPEEFIVLKDARSGNTDAQYKLGKILKAKKAYKVATYWLTKAAEKGHVEAQFELGSCYAKENKYAEAVPWLTKAAEKGHVEAQFELGSYYAKENKYAEAVPWLTKAAEKGHVEAQFELGSCYAKENKYAEAVPWLTKAAEKGHVEAKQLLENVKKWKAAEQFYELSEDRTTLVRCKDKKITVAVIPDFITSIGPQAFQNCTALTSITFQGNNVTSIRTSAFSGCNNLKSIIIPDSVTSIWASAFSGCNSLKFAYIPKDCFVPETAFESNTKLIRLTIEDYKSLEQAEKGGAEAQYRLGQIYFEHKVYEVAVEWYRKSAEQENVDAQCNLGVCYYHGYGVQKDFAKAIEWWQKSAEQGNLYAQNNLGFCCEKGHGVAKDLVMALKWYRKAAEQGHSEAKANAERIEAELTRQQFEAQFKALGPEELTLPGGIKLEMVTIPAGSFQRKGNTVTLTKPFYLGKYEVTQAQWQAVMGSNPSWFKGDNRPVEKVSWNDAKNFCKKLNEIYADKLPAGYQFDLPTEAQWEYACRAGTTTDLNNGKNVTSYYGKCSNLDEVAWYEENSDRRTHEVGQKRANAWGLYDMHGNVWEWCRDRNRNGDSPGGSVTDPVGPSSGSGRVLRGGSCGDRAERYRFAGRDAYVPSSRNGVFGFRLALVPIQ